MNYAIGEFSKVTNLGIHTLRYYEKEKLIVPIRNENGHRRYSEGDIKWIQFIKRLKNTGMPIKQIKEYAEFRSLGDCTLKDRMEMLINHKLCIDKDITLLYEHLEHLKNKINFYQLEIDNQLYSQNKNIQPNVEKHRNI